MSTLLVRAASAPTSMQCGQQCYFVLRTSPCSLLHRGLGGEKLFLQSTTLTDPTFVLKAMEIDGVKIFQCCSSISFANMNSFKNYLLHKVNATFSAR